MKNSKLNILFSLIACAVAITAVPELSSARETTGGGRDRWDGTWTDRSPNIFAAIGDTFDPDQVYGYQWKKGICYELRRSGHHTMVPDYDEAVESCPRRGNMERVDRAYYMTGCREQWKAVRAQLFYYGRSEFPNYKRYCTQGEESDTYRRKYAKTYSEYKKRHPKYKHAKKHVVKKKALKRKHRKGGGWVEQDEDYADAGSIDAGPFDSYED